VTDRHLQHECIRLGESIRKRRIALELSQEDAADLVGVNARHYQKIEGGEVNLTMRTLLKIARGLKLKLRDLFD